MSVKIGRRIASLIAAAVVMICAVCGVLMNISADNGGSFRLICKTPDGVLRENNHWDMYYIGNTVDGERKLLGKFAELAVEVDYSSSSALTDTATTLETYARVNKMTPTASGDSDKNGILTFSGVDNGIYLYMGKKIKDGIKTYVPVPFIAELTDGVNQVDVSPKYTRFLVMAGEDFNYSVKKVWTNGGSRIPKSIDVDIYCEGEYYESVKLGEENDWTYSWDADDFYLWDVVERVVPEGFNVVYRSNEWQYVIVNTLSAQKPGEDYSTTTATSTTDSNVQTKTTASNQTGSNTSDGSSGVQTTISNATDNQTTNGTNTDEKNTDSNNTDNPNTDDKPTGNQTVNDKPTTVNNASGNHESEKLPQTGQLWWPVPVLVLGGLIFVAIGLKLWKKD